MKAIPNVKLVIHTEKTQRTHQVLKFGKCSVSGLFHAWLSKMDKAVKCCDALFRMLR